MTPDELEVAALSSELVSLKNAAGSRSAPDAKIQKRIAELQSLLARKKSGSLTTPGATYNKGGSVIKKSGSKAAKAGVTKFSPVKTTKLAAGGLTKKQTAKVGKVMGEFKDKTLHSGKGGKVVKNPKQAIAIALSEARRVKKK